MTITHSAFSMTLVSCLALFRRSRGQTAEVGGQAVEVKVHPRFRTLVVSPNEIKSFYN